MDLKKIGPYESITPEKREKTLDISTTENRDTRQKITNSQRKTKLLVRVREENY